MFLGHDFEHRKHQKTIRRPRDSPAISLIAEFAFDFVEACLQHEEADWNGERIFSGFQLKLWTWQEVVYLVSCRFVEGILIESPTRLLDCYKPNIVTYCYTPIFSQTNIHQYSWLQTHNIVTNQYSSNFINSLLWIWYWKPIWFSWLLQTNHRYQYSTQYGLVC